MKRWLKKLLRAKRDSSLITINISRSALLHNMEQFKSAKTVVPVLKSNAYGHGLVEVASILENKAEFFIIDSYFEVEALRNEGIKTPLLTIGYVKPENINKNKLKNVSFVISSMEILGKIKGATKIHLKIDTGMNRQGILPDDLEKAVDLIKNNKNIILEGICSHLADTDHNDSIENQITKWNKIVEKIKSEFHSIKYVHLSNTFGHNYTDKIIANTSRLGIGLYGLAQNLKPVLEMKTIITGVKKIKKRETVGYGRTFIAPQDMTIATIPVGYYEGIDRRLSNKGFVKVNEIFCPIVGRISMNITTIDVSEIPEIKIGDEVIVISRNKQDKNSIENISKTIDETKPYEIVVHIPSQLRRVIVE